MPPSQPNGLLTPQQPPQAPPGYTYIPTADGYEIQQDQPGIGHNITNWAADNPLDAAALAATPIPVIGDVAGLANDVRHYWNEPETRTLKNYFLTGAGLLPFVPPAMPIMRAAGKTANVKQTVDHLHDAATYEPASSERAVMAQLLKGNS